VIAFAFDGTIYD
jgi:hypothetical protein